MVDSYYVALIYILAFVKNKGVATTNFLKSVQWLGELLHKQGSIYYFESCNQVSIQNAMNKFTKMGILSKQG